MPGPLVRYRASGRVSPRYAVTAVVALAIAVGVGFAYQAATGGGYVFLNLVAYVAFVIAVLAAVVAAGRLGRNRNRPLGAVVGLAIGGVALAAAYYFDWRAMAGDAGGALPFGAFVERRVAAGWTLGGRAAGEAGTLTGGWVGLVWIVEAIGALAPALAFGAGFGPFCERCGRWMDAAPVRQQGGLDAAAAATVARAATVDELLRPPVVPARPGSFALTYTAHRCRRCAIEAYLTVRQAQTTPVDRPPPGRPYKTAYATLHAQVQVPDAQLAALASPAA